MLQEIVFGTIQGIAEWLPISSEGMTFLAGSLFFGIKDISFVLEKSLFLHLGTFFACLIYFRKEIIRLTGAVFNYRRADIENKRMINFLFVSTFFTGIIGILFLLLLDNFESYFTPGTKVTIFLIGLFLVITGIFQIKSKVKGVRKIDDLKPVDAILLGLVQGLAVLPGFSRSGMTVSALLLRNFQKIDALRLSFLMSLPVVLGANILINLKEILLISFDSFFGLAASFIFGLLTIDILLKFAKKVNFGRFVLVIGLLTIISVFV